MMKFKTRFCVKQKKIFAFLVVVPLLASCASSMEQYYLELTGKPNTRCEIKNDTRVVGTFTVPSTINLGSGVGKVEAYCTINNQMVVAKVHAKDPQCHDQIVVKGPCLKPTSTIDSVEIIIRQSQ